MSCQVIEGLDKLPAEVRRGVLTIGNFDGVHLGHQEILRTAREAADSVRAPLHVLTFDPPPTALLAPGEGAETILPKAVKYDLLGRCGTDAIVVIHTTRALLSTPPEGFVRGVVAGRLSPVRVVEGPNFSFGHDRAGNIDTLRRLAGEGGFEMTQVQPVRLELPGRGTARVSSSLVRELVLCGDVVSAGRCLGRPYTLHGRVVGGERRGRTLKFPTANVRPAGVICPGDGVYAARAKLGQAAYPAAVSIGNKPTFGPAERCVEAHLLGAVGDLYDQTIALAFVQRLRDQIKFPDAESLRAQVGKDVERVRELCR